MVSHSITNYKELQDNITTLKIQKLAQEESLKAEFNHFKKFIRLDELVEKTANLTPSQQTYGKIPKAGLNIGAELLIDQVWGRHHNILSFLTAFSARRISALLINKTRLIENLSNKIIGIFK